MIDTDKITRKKKITMLFSFYNEVEVLPELISRVESVFTKLNYNLEMIFVNDDSTDGSLLFLKKQLNRNKNIKIINMSRRFGPPPCVMAGFKHSTGDALIYMDSDLQDPPEILPQLIKKWEEGFDVVHTTRVKRKGESFIKLWFTKKAYSLINLFSEIEILKNTGDFKLLSRKAINSVLSLNENDPFIRGLSIWIGFKQTQVFYIREPRFIGQSKFPNHGISITTIKEFLRGISSFSSVPLYLSLYLGFFVSFSSFSFLIYILITRIFYDLHLPGWPALMATNLFLGGTILFSIGILGIYVGKIHQELKRRPKYIIKDKIGFKNIDN